MANSRFTDAGDKGALASAIVFCTSVRICVCYIFINPIKGEARELSAANNCFSLDS